MKPHLTKLSNSGQEDNSKILQFSGWFSRFCQALGITKTGEIATFCEVSPSLVSDWKAGRAYPRPEVLLKAANCGGTTIDWILTGENSKKSKDNPPPSQDFGDQMTSLGIEIESTIKAMVREVLIEEGLIQKKTDPTRD
jgi:transcriptional regulator with XRE-family HTH domain